MINTVIKKTMVTALAALLLAAGCRTAVDIQGSYGIPGQTISGGFSATTNSVTVDGAYQTGATNISGSVTLQK